MFGDEARAALFVAAPVSPDDVRPDAALVLVPAARFGECAAVMAPIRARLPAASLRCRAAPLNCGDLAVDVAERLAVRGGRPLPLHPREFAVSRLRAKVDGGCGRLIHIVAVGYMLSVTCGRLIGLSRRRSRR